MFQRFTHTSPSSIAIFESRFRKSYEREIKGLKEDLELERQAAIDYARHKSRMSDLLAQLQAQVEMLSEVFFVLYFSSIKYAVFGMMSF